MPFVKGQSGNPKGKPAGSARLEKQVHDLLVPLVPDSVVVIRKALKEGEAWAAKEVLDRVYGKATSTVEVSGKEGGPLVAVIKDS